LVSLLLISVLVIGTGCNKITGGGWFIDKNTGNKITIGLNAQPLDEPFIVDGEVIEGLLRAKGQLQLVDHVTKERIHCEFIGTADASSPTTADFGGPATINREGGFVVSIEMNFKAIIPGQPDVWFIAIAVMDEDNIDPSNALRTIIGILSGDDTLSGGNIFIHDK